MKKLTNEISESAKKSLITRTLTAIVLVLVTVPCLILGGWYFLGFTAVISIIAAFEIVKASNLKGLIKVLVYYITIVFTVGIIYFVIFQNNVGSGASISANKDILNEAFGRGIDLSIMLITVMLSVYFLISFSSEPFNIAYVFYFVTMILVIAIGIQSLLFLRFTPFLCFGNQNISEGQMVSSLITRPEFKYWQSMFLSIYVIIGVTFNDMGAYFVGLLFGKHKMNERISPKKTWEGFIGGVVFSIIFSTLFALICALTEHPILPIFDSKHLYYVIIISILIPLIADVGDFVFSSIKRTFGVKDFSNLLPGHGGVLDRIDSLIFAAALVSCLIAFIYLIEGTPLNGLGI